MTAGETPSKLRTTLATSRSPCWPRTSTPRCWMSRVGSQVSSMVRLRSRRVVSRMSLPRQSTGPMLTRMRLPRSCLEAMGWTACFRRPFPCLVTRTLPQGKLPIRGVWGRRSSTRFPGVTFCVEGRTSGVARARGALYRYIRLLSFVFLYMSCHKVLFRQGLLFLPVAIERCHISPPYTTYVRYTALSVPDLKKIQIYKEHYLRSLYRCGPNAAMLPCYTIQKSLPLPNHKHDK